VVLVPKTPIPTPLSQQNIQLLLDSVIGLIAGADVFEGFAFLIDQEQIKVPAHICNAKLTLDKLVYVSGIVAIHICFFEELKSFVDTDVCFANILTNIFMCPWFLTTKLVSREGQNFEHWVLIHKFRNLSVI